MSSAFEAVVIGALATIPGGLMFVAAGIATGWMMARSDFGFEDELRKRNREFFAYLKQGMPEDSRHDPAEKL